MEGGGELLSNPGPQYLFMALADPAAMYDCSTDSVGNGNYTLQDIVEIASKLRAAVAVSPNLASCLSGFKAENRGLDPFGEACGFGYAD